jgi:penicillin amidase
VDGVVVSTQSPLGSARRPWLSLGVAALLLVLGGVLVARNFGAQRTLQRALPIVDGRIEVRGLEAELTILRDGHGVPHIWAKSARDAWFGLGFVQAQDRLAQLSFLVRAARGRTAEVLGPEALDADRLARTLGFGRLGDAQLMRLDASTRRVLDAHAAGISAWIEEVKSGRAVTPVPLTRLGVPLETWSAADSLAVAKLVAWGLDGSLDATLVLSDLIEKLGGFGARPFFPPEAAREMTPRPPDFAANTREAWRDPLRARLGLAGRSVGSSAWVIAAGDAEGGAPIVTGDLHLAPTVPALLYEAHLAAPDFEVAGAGVPGVPAFWSGHNGRVAWVATHARAVATDLYVETLDPEAPDRYRVGGDSRALAVRQERIAVRGRDDVALTVRETQHGPLVEGLLPGARPALAVAWGGAQPGDGVAALLRAPLARNADELRAALAAHHEPVFAFVFADAAGRGGRQVAGWLPERSMPTGLVPVPGRSPWYDWRGRVSFEALPHEVLDDSGFVIAADNALGGGAAIEWWWRSGERASRIETLLREAHERGPIGATALAAILADQRSAAAPARVRALLRGIGDPAALAPEARTVARLLSEWDGTASTESVGAAAWQVLLGAVIDSLVEAPLGRDLAARYLAVRGTSQEALLDALLDVALAPEPPQDAIVNADAVRAAVREGLRRTGLTLRVQLGSNAERWQWGRLHLLHFEAFGWPARAWPGVAEEPSWPYGGDGVTVAVGEYDAASPYAVRVVSAYRLLVDLASPSVALSALVPGATEHASDPLRMEGVERWLAGRPGVLATQRFLVEDGARARLILEPQR